MTVFSRSSWQELLGGLVESGEIKARTKWKEIYPQFAEDNRYLDMLGNPGSNPIELFWDVVDALDQKLDAKIAIAEAAIKRYNDGLDIKMENAEVKIEDNAVAQASQKKPFEVGPDTAAEEFLKIVKANSDSNGKILSDTDLLEIYHSVRIRLLG